MEICEFLNKFGEHSSVMNNYYGKYDYELVKIPEGTENASDYSYTLGEKTGKRSVLIGEDEVLLLSEKKKILTKQLYIPNATLDYVLYNLDGFKYAIITKYKLYTDTFEVPAKIENVPVLFVNFDVETIREDQITKVILGDYIVGLSNYSTRMTELNQIEIKKTYKCPPIYLINLIRSLTCNASHRVKLESKNSDFVVENNCLLSKDGKHLIFALDRGQISVPQSVRYIESESIRNDLTTKSIIIWPDILIDVKEQDLNPHIMSKILKNYPLPRTYKELNCTTILCNLEGDEYARFRDERTINFPPKVVNISPKAVQYYFWNNPTIEINDYFVMIDEMLLSIDKKTLFFYGGKKKLLCLPAEVEEIRENAFNILSHPKQVILEQINSQMESILKRYKIELILRNKEIKESVKKSESPKESVNTTNGNDVEYKTMRNKTYLANGVKADKLALDITKFVDKPKKTFVIDSNCSNIRELVIPEGVTNIEIDPTCYDDEFKLTILELPQSCKFTDVLENLDQIKSLMLLIIDPAIKPRWNVHKLSYIVACKGKHKMPIGVVSNYKFNSYNYSPQYSVFNEITYINRFDRDRLIENDYGFFYVINLSRKEIRVLKVKPGAKEINYQKIEKYTVKEYDDYCYSKIK